MAKKGIILVTMVRVASVFLAFVLTLSFMAPPAFAKDDFEVKEKVFIHNPRPGKPGKPPQGSYCTLYGDDKVGDYSVAGWNMPEGGMTYKINTSSMPYNVSVIGVEAIKKGFEEWTNNDKAKKFFYDGQTLIGSAKYDGTNTIAWKRINSSAIAITYTWYRTDTNTVVETDTLFNNNLPWTVQQYEDDGCYPDVLAYDVQNIATHEFGHWVGLNDLYSEYDEALTMYGYGSFGEVKKDTLGTGDKEGLSSVLP